MFRWIAMGFFVVLAGCDSNEPEGAFDWRGWCAIVEDAAEEIMLSRQAGVPLSRALNIIDPNGMDDSMIPDLVLMAYEHPRYQNESIASEAVRDFTDMAYRECVKIHRVR